MSYEKIHTDEPDSWVPGVFGMFNQKGLREEHQRRWAQEANDQNKARPISQKLTGRHKVTTELVMLDEAEADNKAYDEAQLDPKKAGVPDHLYHQKLAEGTLRELGVDKKSFETPDELNTAINQSDVALHEASHKAFAEIRPHVAKQLEESRTKAA